MATWCQSKLPWVSRRQAEDITEEFVDYWRGVAGAKGLKADWPATWRNWIKRKANDTKPNGASGRPVPPPRNGHVPYQGHDGAPEDIYSRSEL